jgi:predicted metal-dependent enzyme (double-stranded beta helix superfamily)
MEQESHAFITATPAVAEFDPEFANLKANLNAWIGDAVRAPRIATGLNQLCKELEGAISRGLISLPERLRAVRPDTYARRLVYEDAGTGISVLAMVWAPGQATKLHDHSGLWGVEAVLAGEIENVPFNLIAKQNDQYYFHARPAERVAAGSTSHVLPPFEHHVTRNVSQEVAITLNIYGGPMPACNIFLPTGLGSYVRQRRGLSYSD